MRTSTFHRTMFLAGMMTASLAFADPDVVKCVDAAGKVTLTNEPCADGTVAQAEPGKAAPQRERTASASPIVMARAEPRHSAWMKNPSAARKPSLDAATLKEARLNLQESDKAWHAMRQMRLASN